MIFNGFKIKKKLSKYKIFVSFDGKSEKGIFLKKKQSEN